MHDPNALSRRNFLGAAGATLIDEGQAGQTVFVKPNAVHPFALGVAGITTSGSVVGALVKMLKERGATVIVGDRCARGFSSSMTLNDSGIAEAAEKAGADEIFGAVAPSAEPDAWVLKQPPGWEGSWQAQGGIQAMRKIVEADHFINVAVCKDHRWAGVSLTMKNLIGAVGDDSRDQMHYVAKDVEALSRDIATLNGAFSPLLNLVDAQSCVVNGGPEGIAGDAVITAPGLIIAGRDRVAVDALGTSLIQYEQVGATVPDPDAVQEVLRSTPAWQLPQLTRGIELGLGVAGPDAVVLRLEGLDAALQEGLETRYRA